MDNEKEMDESVNEDIFEEDSGLEEKQDLGVDVIPEKGISLPLGMVLNNESLYRLASKKKIDFICIHEPILYDCGHFGRGSPAGSAGMP